MTKAEKLHRQINDGFSGRLAAAFKAKFNLDLETRWNIFTMALVSMREDGKDFTPEQHAWISAYSDGYTAAMVQVA